MWPSDYSSSLSNRKSSSYESPAQPSLVADLVLATSRAHVRYPAQSSRCIWSRRDAFGSLKATESPCPSCCNAVVLFLLRPTPDARAGLIPDGRANCARFQVFPAALYLTTKPDARAEPTRLATRIQSPETIARACLPAISVSNERRRTGASLVLFLLSPHTTQALSRC